MRTMHPQHPAQPRGSLARSLSAVLLGTCAILLVPLVAMRFTREVDWTVFDFAVAGLLLAATGSLFVLVQRKLRGAPQRLAAGAGLLLALVLVWAELAVGIFGSPFAGS